MFICWLVCCVVCIVRQRGQLVTVAASKAWFLYINNSHTGHFGVVAIVSLSKFYSHCSVKQLLVVTRCQFAMGTAVSTWCLLERKFPIVLTGRRICLH